MLTGDEREVNRIVGRGERLLPLVERGRPLPPDIRCWLASQVGSPRLGAP